MSGARRSARPWALAGAGLVAGLVAGGIPAALAAADTVPASKAFTTAVTIGPNDVKPNECDAITVATVLIGTGADLVGTTANGLMLGTPGDERRGGRGGNDVVVGGPGDDTIHGGTGTDACHGNVGNDTFTQCELTVQ